jgi:hypothetical protein
MGSPHFLIISSLALEFETLLRIGGLRRFATRRCPPQSTRGLYGSRACEATVEVMDYQAAE